MFLELWEMLIDCVVFFVLVPLFVCGFAACVFVFSFGCSSWCLGFLRSILSWTDLRPVLDKIDLKK